MTPSMLIIDDDDSIAANAPNLMSGGTWEVHVVREIEEAPRGLDARQYDVILLDIALTGALIENGIDLLFIARRAQPRAKIVVISAFGSGDVVGEASRRGADRFLHKPISFRDIEAEVRTLLGEDQPEKTD